MATNGKIVGLVVVILIALGFMAKQTTTDKRITTKYKQVLVDVQANKLFLKEFKIAENPVFPVESPFSTGKNAYRAIQCGADKTIFALDTKPLPEGTDPAKVDGELYRPRCPICGSPIIDGPKIPEGQKSMDIPGPVQTITVPREK